MGSLSKVLCQVFSGMLDCCESIMFHVKGRLVFDKRLLRRLQSNLHDRVMVESRYEVMDNRSITYLTRVSAI